MEILERHADESMTVCSYIVMPQHLNAGGTLFGGQLLSWIDMTAGIVAMRHADRNVVTVCIDHMHFENAARKSDVVTLRAYVTWTGKTSMEVKVETWKENKGGRQIHINTAYFVMVAMDDDQKPTTVPKLILETEEQKAEWQAACKRAEIRALRRKESF